MSTLYVEPFAGMAGDMFLAAVLDLGDPRFTLEDLRELARALVPGECTIEVERAWRGNLSGLLLTVRTAESERSPHRTYADIERLVDAAPLKSPTKNFALAVFRRIAVAEARVHGTTPEEIHFHEIGAVDTLVDVCGASLALERLEIERVVSDVPISGTGTVRCAHGEMPVPAPAVAEIMRGRPLSIRGGGGERLTPTGAALLCEMTEIVHVASADAPPARDGARVEKRERAAHGRIESLGESLGGSRSTSIGEHESLDHFISERIGYGAGARDPDVGPPNVLRVQLGRSAPRAERTAVWMMEVNLDDMTGEEIAGALERLRGAGALDVWSSPVLMKKGRPGVVVSALCRADERAALELATFESTTTLGVRWIACTRTECVRATLDVDLDGNRVRVKVRERPAHAGASAFGQRDLSPEHDDVSAAAARLGIGVRETEQRAIALALRALSSRRES